MKVLIIGGGAREHALAWKIRRDRPDVELLLAPGNAGSAALGTAFEVAADDVDGLLRLASEQRPELTICGPEAPLAAGIADRFAAAGLALFGPTRAAAEIEWSKGWAKAFMHRHGIPTARSATFDSLAEAEDYVRRQPEAPVIKDDALASGKGVTVAASTEQALEALRGIFRRAGARVVIEERLEGWELSAHAFCDGRSARLLPFACDYKRVGEGDTGPNTGGMGAYAPPAVPDALRERIEREIVQPAVAGLAAEGRPFVGLLYPGLMITPQGPKTIEFNCRFGDPETEALLPLLESDLLDILLACVRGQLDRVRPRWSSQSCCTVVLAAPGYPEKPQPADISGIDGVRQAVVFRYGGTGRLLAVSALGASLQAARERAYEDVRRIQAPGVHYRADIARHDRAAARPNAAR
ncbi:MAG: phosphoribosylamine--glycine ligase [Chloroflexota bacterium]|nr:phosphoribosylamine--glycine ligase [Chloroflexota bacterium]